MTRRLIVPLARLIVPLAALLVACGRGTDSYDILIRGGSVLDGTGAPAWVTDVAIRGDAITRIGDLSAASATVAPLVSARSQISAQSPLPGLAGSALSRSASGPSSSVTGLSLTVGREVVLDGGAHTGALPGRVIRRRSQRN